MYATPMGAGKTTYTFSANTNVLSANFPFSMLPAGGVGMGQAAEMESTLALAENVYVNLPTPHTHRLLLTTCPISVILVIHVIQ